MCVYMCAYIHIYMGASMCNIYSIKDQTINIYFLISKYICMYQYIANAYIAVYWKI